QQKSCRQPEKQSRKIAPSKRVVPGASRKQPGSVSHSLELVIRQLSVAGMLFECEIHSEF
ncbi:MAG TPA: hypothetical protein VGB68_06875, partial [Pyrinomonadaceae bacterium]